MRIGVDLIEFSEFKKRISSSSRTLDRLLSLQERDGDLPTLAGKVAAKEAIIKTGYVRPGEWLKVRITHRPTGEPVVYEAEGALIGSLSISISHTKRFVVAVAVWEKAW